MVKMVIYDCDGVIFDSKKANLEYYNYILKHFGLPPVEEDDKEKLNIIHTFSNDEVIKNLFPKELSMKAIEFSKTVDYSMFYKYMKIEPEFFETCEKLKEKGILISIATNRSKTFPHLYKFFKLDKVIDDYVTVSIIKKPKPAPDMLLYLLKKNNILSNQTIYIGDSIIDYEASKKAGIKFIGYKEKFNKAPKINKHSEILKYLQNR